MNLNFLYGENADLYAFLPGLVFSPNTYLKAMSLVLHTITRCAGVSSPARENHLHQLFGSILTSKIW